MRGVQRGDRTVAPVAADAKRLSHGRFQDLLVYRPNGTPTSFVLFLSGDEGWNAATDAMARQLAQQGAMVVGIDWAEFKATLEADGDALRIPGRRPGKPEPLRAGLLSQPDLSVADPGRRLLGRRLCLRRAGAGAAQHLCRQRSPSVSAPAWIWRNRCARDRTRIRRRGPADLLPIKSLGNPWLNLQGDGDRACPVARARDFISQIHGAAIGDAAEGGS